MRRLAFAALVVALLVTFVQPTQAQTPQPPAYVQQLVANMTPEERVGQLFLVTFQGMDTSESSDIYDLIVNYHIGGVVLLASNDNFTAAPNTVADAYQLISQLQEIERASAGMPMTDPTTGQEKSRAFIPLWVGITQDGNGAPTDQILDGLTPLPSEMALGATWQPDLAEQVGAVAGQELSALGFNLYFGPSLDVLDSPSSASVGDLGTRVFGGDPFWVGEMGRAYITGLHRGSNGRLTVIAKNFPGRGSSDRLPDVEVATVRKSLEQLKQIELAPFFSVTGNAPDEAATTDGLLVSHIRYRGFQGNIRATTRPVSFDPQALSAILKLPEFAQWHDGGGLIVSDDLGSRAVRDFYTTGGTFSARLVARDAFLAGNDMLYLGNIVSSDAADTPSTVRLVLSFFAQKYREDPAFAARVDAAVTRILTRKNAVYSVFSSATLTPSASQLVGINTSEQVTFQVATNAATLVSPDRQELDTVLPEPPGATDYIVFLTDSNVTRQCSTCPDEPTLAADALQQSILRLYGISSGGELNPGHLKSYAFKDLANLLDGTGGEFIEPDLRRANWIVISLAGTSANQPQLVRRFLSERQELLRSKRVILFSFGAPYYFDSTDISRLTAYFALYSKAPPFVDVAARILFRELPLVGNSPVSIQGTGYNLINVTAPDPDQIISLFLDLPPAATPQASPSLTTEPTAVPLVRIGDTVSIRTGEIYDQNGNLVPDETVVQFTVNLIGELGGVIEQQEAQTSAGVAHISYRLAKPGLIEIRAASEPATISQVLQLDVTENEAVVVTVIVPVASETVTPVVDTPTPLAESDFVTLGGKPRFGGWLLILFMLMGGGWLAYWVGLKLGAHRWSVRWALCAVIGGLVAYNYLALGLPGASDALRANGGGALVVLTLAGEILGAVGAWLWMRNSK